MHLNVSKIHNNLFTLVFFSFKVNLLQIYLHKLSTDYLFFHDIKNYTQCKNILALAFELNINPKIFIRFSNTLY